MHAQQGQAIWQKNFGGFPVTRSSFEPTLAELLADPIVEVLMKADGVSPAGLRETLRLAADKPQQPRTATRREPQPRGFV